MIETMAGFFAGMGFIVAVFGIIAYFFTKDIDETDND